MINRLSFRNKLLLSMASLLLVALLMLSLLSGYLLRKEVAQAVESEMQASLQLTRSTALQWLEGKSQVMRALASRLPARPANWAAWEEPLTLGLLAGEFDLLYVGTNRGEMIQSQPPGQLPEGFDPRVRPWYLQARSENRLILTQPYVDAVTGDLIISLAKPLKHEPDSILGADLMISGIVRQLLATETRWTSRIWMLNDQQALLAHPDPAMLQRQLKDVLPDYDPREPAIQSVHHDDRDWLAASISVPQVGWTFLLLVDAKEVHEGVRQMGRQLTLLSLLVIVVSALLLYLLTARLTRPLVRFQQQLGHITETLDLSQRLETHDQAEL
ncbi:cache domain-containing protein, partial [Marinospirillum alkaliphilum]